MDQMLADASNPSAPTFPYPSRKRLHAEMLAFAQPQTWRGIVLLVLDFAIYFAALAGVLFLVPLWAKIACSLVAGVKISNLATIGHDAAHGSLVREIWLNKVLGVLAFLPAFFNCRLWVYDHHILHHPKVNGRHRDSFMPYSKAEFDRLPRYRQRLERLYRAPLGLGFGIYYVFERWLPVKVFPRSFMPAGVRREAWRNLFWLAVWAVLLTAGMVSAPLYSQTSALTAVLLGIVVPHYVWMTLMAMTSFVQHTHPNVAWFADGRDRGLLGQPELVSTQVDFPRWFKTMMHNVHDHAAHHVQPRIPGYRLADAQARLNELLGPYAVSEMFSFGRFADTVGRCKLYDYDRLQWLDFEGRPTTKSLLVSASAQIADEKLVPLRRA